MLSGPLVHQPPFLARPHEAPKNGTDMFTDGAGNTFITSLKLVPVLLAVAVLAACGGGGMSTTPPPTPATAPTVTGFTPASGLAGTPVTITGTAFAGATALKFNGTTATFTVVSATQITTSVPAGATSGKISVTTSAGTASSAGSFTVTSSTPTITSFAPASGVVGTTITIAGTNFTGATAVAFNGTAATFTVASATQITAAVPAAATTGKITVTTPSGTATSVSNFTVLPPVPTITSFTPASGLIAAAVTITGTNFTGTSAVRFNGTPATFTVTSATQITATVPAAATTGKITVTTSGGTATSASSFTVTPSAPTIASFSPTTGQIGLGVTITGAGFTGATSVKFNGTAATFTVASATQITTTVPTGATTGKITVSTGAGSATSASNFTVSTSSATLDLTVDGLYVTQATQDYPTPIIPLVKDRSAWVRVFVKANQTNTVTPQVRVRFVKGTTTNTLTINSTQASVPTSVDPNTLTSWNAAVPSAWILTGTQVIADVDPSGAISESDKTNNQFTATLDVRTLKPWKITLVPVKTGTRTGTVTTPSRTKESWLDLAKRLHPVPDAIDIVVGATFTSSATTLSSNGTGWDTVLSELRAKRTADGVTDRYYFGSVNVAYSSGVAGLGYIGFPAAIGWDYAGSAPEVLAHEEGHNFGRPHSPCGGVSGADPSYPYPGGIIGVTGWDVFATSNNLKDDATYKDIMGYCDPKWISDYVYLSELNFRASSSLGIVVPDVVSASNPKEGLLIWGRIDDGKVVLEPAFRTPFRGALPAVGQYKFEARDAMGNMLASVSFDAEEVADLPEGSAVRMFSFVVPMSLEALNAVASLRIAQHDGTELTHVVSRAAADAIGSADSAVVQNEVQMLDLPNRSVQFTWDAAHYPVIMVRDAKTGEVRGFLRGGQAEIEDAPSDLEVQFSDGVRSHPQPHTRNTN